MNKPIPLVEYFNRLAYPDGVPSRSFRAPPRDAADDPTWQSEYDAMTANFAAAEKAAWEQIVSDALSGRIEIHAFEYVQRNDPNAEWYPESYATVRTRIPPVFFFDETAIGPAAPVVIYYTGRGKPNIFNAPWRDPVVFKARLPRRKRGAKAQYDWPAIEAAFNARVGEIGYPDDQNEDGWRSQADVERWIAALAARGVGREPSESLCREHARRFLAG